MPSPDPGPLEPLEFDLPLPPWFRRPDLLAYWGRDPKSRSERVEGTKVTWALRLAPEGLPALLEADLADGRARARLHLVPGDTGTPPTADEAVERTRSLLARLLALHQDPSPFETEMRARPEDPLARHVARRPGLAVPQTPTAFDGAVWVIAGQQVSLGAAFSIRRRLTDALGTPLGANPIDGSPIDGRLIDGSPLRVPPAPATVAAAGVDTLFAHGFSRRKAEYLHGLARSIVGEPAGTRPDPDSLDRQRLEAGSSDAERFDLEGLGRLGPAAAEQTLLGVRGLGPWSVHYLLMRSYGFPDQVPAGDAALARALHRLHGLDRRPNAERTRELMERYAPHRSLASFHCWAALADPELADPA